MRSRLAHLLIVSVLGMGWLGAAAAYYEAATACSAMAARGATCCEMSRRDRVGAPQADCCRSVKSESATPVLLTPTQAHVYAPVVLPSPMPLVQVAPSLVAGVHQTAHQRAPPNLIFIDTVVLLI